jgi:hypothetical protein
VSELQYHAKRYNAMRLAKLTAGLIYDTDNFTLTFIAGDEKSTPQNPVYDLGVICTYGLYILL